MKLMKLNIMQDNKLTAALLLAFFVLAVISCQPEQKKDATDEPAGQEQTEEQQETDKEEQKEETPKTQTYSIPDAMPYYKKSDEFLTDKFLPIGWSKNGNFAYITEYADEACGCYSMQMNVVGPQAKDTLWTFQFESMDYKKTLPGLWEEERELFRKKLNEFDIIQQEDFEIQDPKFSVNGQKYDVSLKTETEKDPYFGFDVVKAGKVSLVTPDGKEHVRTFTEPSPSMILDAAVHGVIKSPYQKRIMIIYKRERRGYEGPPHVVTFKLAGTKL